MIHDRFFSIQELYDISPTQKYAAIIVGIDLDLIYHLMLNQSQCGALESLNYPAMITTWTYVKISDTVN